MVLEQLYAFQIIYEMKLKYFNRREAGYYNRPSICSIQQSNRLDYMFVLRTRCPWKMLPQEYGSGSTCHRRFQDRVKQVYLRNYVQGC